MPRLTLDLPTELRLSVRGSRTDSGHERRDGTATLGNESRRDRSAGVDGESASEEDSALVRWHECWADDQ